MHRQSLSVDKYNYTNEIVNTDSLDDFQHVFAGIIQHGETA